MDTVYEKIDQPRAGRIVSALCTWYNASKRDLPWRRDAQPYAVWVCEVMAQQTQIATLLPYYEKFMRLFPTVGALAEADIEAVLKAWEGLGYYTRAHNLHKAAVMVMEQFGGRMPQTEKELKRLPGVGDYTAGAVLSIAFNQRAPAVDGNVLRVFARLENNTEDIASPAVKTALKDVIRAIMPSENTGVFTQSLMELGALVCTPKSPSCGACPLDTLCKARQNGVVDALPVKSAKKPHREADKTVLLVENRAGEVLMRKRSERLLNGLWEFYSVEGKLDDGDVTRHLLANGFDCPNPVYIGNARHVFTHLIWRMEGFHCAVGGETPPPGYVFIRKDAVQSVPVPAAHGFFLKYLLYNL